MVHKKKGGSFFSRNISNRLSYVIVSLVAFVLAVVLVYAAGGPYGNGGVGEGNGTTIFTVPNPGHHIGEITPPTGCGAGQFLKYNGSIWTCASVPGGVGGTGTANKLAKFTGTSTLGNSVIIDDGTNVGIGTTNPTTKLEVNGGVKATQLDVSGGIKATQVNATGFCFGSIYPGDCATSWPTADSLNALYNCSGASSTFASGSSAGYANCAAGQIVIGGGGTCGSGSLKTSQPTSASWMITCSSSGGGTVNAICCNY